MAAPLSRMSRSSIRNHAYHSATQSRPTLRTSRHTTIRHSSNQNGPRPLWKRMVNRLREDRRREREKYEFLFRPENREELIARWVAEAIPRVIAMLVGLYFTGPLDMSIAKAYESKLRRREEDFRSEHGIGKNLLDEVGDANVEKEERIVTPDISS